MEDNDNSKGIKRRAFLQTGGLFVASTVFIPLSAYEVFGAINPRQAESSIPSVMLNNGIAMPRLGFGTNTLNGDLGTRCVSDAISVGYRLIDTAKIYGNEASVGKGIKQSGINREALFITSKLWVDDAGYESTKKAFETSLEKLGLEYLDLYLIHRPRGDVKGSWKAQKKLLKHP